MKLKKKYKLILSIIIICLITFVTYLILKSRDYKVNYVKNDFNIDEAYDKHKKIYEFRISKDDITYEFSLSNKYVQKKKIINDIVYYETENGEKCVLPKGKKLEFYPVCYDGNDFIDYDLLSYSDDNFYKREKTQIVKSDYKNIEVSRVDDKMYLIWANKGYYYISNVGNKEIMFLNNESYYNNLAYKINEFVITPNYDEEYTFSTLFIVNMKNGKVTEWKLEENISFNSYYLGDKNGLVYLFDRKEKKEYSLDVKRKKLELVSKDGNGKVWNEEWETVSTVKLASDDYKFSDRGAHNFRVEDNKLIVQGYNLKNNMILSQKKSMKILSCSDREVYYLVNDELYEYSFYLGEELLLEYNEWNFNNNNSVFIYEK